MKHCILGNHVISIVLFGLSYMSSLRKVTMIFNVQSIQIFFFDIYFPILKSQILLLILMFVWVFDPFSPKNHSKKLICFKKFWSYGQYQNLQGLLDEAALSDRTCVYLPHQYWSPSLPMFSMQCNNEYIPEKSIYILYPILMMLFLSWCCLCRVVLRTKHHYHDNRKEPCHHFR